MPVRAVWRKTGGSEYEQRWWGPADDVRAICEAATGYSQGYLLVTPDGRQEWTTNGYLQCKRYLTLDATHDSVEIAASALLDGLESDDE